jgi:hypothetical protein
MFLSTTLMPAAFALCSSLLATPLALPVCEAYKIVKVFAATAGADGAIWALWPCSLFAAK